MANTYLRSGWWVFILPFLWSYVTFTVVASYCDVVVISKYYKWDSTEAMLRVAGSLLIAQGLFADDVSRTFTDYWTRLVSVNFLTG